MARNLPVAVAILAVLAAGVVHGLWSDRWATAMETAESAARLERVALHLGDWEGQPLDQKPRQAEPLAGYLYRKYTHRRTGAVVVATLVCGRPGPVSIHTPDVCYNASGYEVEPQSKFELARQPGAPPDVFWTSNLRKSKETNQTNLRIFWSWSATGAWQVADNPRFAFVRCPVLYKLYLIRDLADPKEPLNEDDPCVELMRLLLPELEEKLFSPT